ncbi:DUF1566 domain-containing protein [Desulfolithobacter dissulfuricans]|nr:DUF1566 domain-containing protein [Desulfolithobacter dissulfuricans]
MRHVAGTGQTRCYDSEGRETGCNGTGQDGELRPGEKWPDPRFHLMGETVLDNLTGLVWSRDANPGVFPLTWQEAIDRITELNREGFAGYSDWRLPNRRELRSLMSYQAKKPALPDKHPFTNVYLSWYWTSTTAVINPAYAWWVHLEGARMFYGSKSQYAFFWPVHGPGNNLLPATGQQHCYDSEGSITSCHNSGQDGEYQAGNAWPVPRFSTVKDAVLDRLTGLTWTRQANLCKAPVTWQEALRTVNDLNRSGFAGRHTWHLPSINELESLVDAGNHSPALPPDHPFTELQEGYWTATTSFFETDWAWVLYLHKGACGVSHKSRPLFHVWPVADT